MGNPGGASLPVSLQKLTKVKGETESVWSKTTEENNWAKQLGKTTEQNNWAKQLSKTTEQNN